jgi:poly(3-hydroxybutyrate) depolymerase
MRLFIATLFIACFSAFAAESEIDYKNSYDASMQKAAVYVPENYDKTKKTPLLVIAHYMGGNRFTAKKQGYYPECEKRGWLLICPELHGKRTGGRTSLAYIGAQHDIIDCVEYMKKNYNVDASRIYLAGRSMGGMLSEVMAAKYPDVWAAVMAGQGISDLELWMKTAPPKLIQVSEKEVLPLSKDNIFDIKRRSAVSYAPNLQYVPLMLWHGTNDTWVPPGQSEKLTALIRKFDKYQPDVFWLLDACHCARNYTPEWICGKLEYYQNSCEAGFKTPMRFFDSLQLITDESKSFFWLDIKLAKENSFADIDAHFKDGLLTIDAHKISELGINLDNVSAMTPLKSLKAKSDKPMKIIIRKKGEIKFETEIQGSKVESFGRDINGK